MDEREGATAFRMVLRGYDPDQVRSTMAELSGSLTVARRTAAERTMELSRVEERNAALQAELAAVKRHPPVETPLPAEGTGAFVDMGTRVSTILSLAEQEAGHLRAEAHEYADGIRRSAEAEAERVRVAGTQAARSRQQAVTELHGVLAVLAEVDAQLAGETPGAESEPRR